MKVIDTQTAKELLLNGNIKILDIRDPASYAHSHIDQAIHLNLNQLLETVNQFDKEQSVLVYCYHGISSLRVAQALEDLDFKQVFSLEGGFAAWS
jgi:thiosulfate sulfurtransferase